MFYNFHRPGRKFLMFTNQYKVWVFLFQNPECSRKHLENNAWWFMVCFGLEKSGSWMLMILDLFLMAITRELSGFPTAFGRKLFAGKCSCLRFVLPMLAQDQDSCPLRVDCPQKCWNWEREGNSSPVFPPCPSFWLCPRLGGQEGVVWRDGTRRVACHSGTKCFLTTVSRTSDALRTGVWGYLVGHCQESQEALRWKRGLCCVPVVAVDLGQDGLNAPGLLRHLLSSCTR